MQIKIPLEKQLVPKKGMAVRPIPGKLVPSAIIHGWERGMIYDVGNEGETGMPIKIKGIARGREFCTVEFLDNIEER